MSNTTRHFILALLLLLIALVSGTIYALRSSQRRVLFFPTQDGGIAEEVHLLPRSWGSSVEVRETVKEILLGPISLDLSPLLPMATKMNSFILRDTVVYVDLSADELAGTTQTLDAEALVDTFFVRSLRYNFPYLTKINLTVDGQVPGQIPFTIFEK